MPGKERNWAGPRNELPPWCRWLLLVTVVVELGSCVFSFVRAATGGVAVDFLAFDVGGKLVGSDPHHLYVLTAQNAALSDVLGYHAQPVGYLLFVNPPFAAELLRPLSALPLQMATDVFLIISVAALLGAFAIGRSMLAAALPRRDATLVAAALVLTSSAAYSLLLGQWGPLLLLLTMAGMKLLECGRPVAGGAVLALLLVKPQVAYLVPFALLGARDLRAAASFAASTLVLALASLAIVGTGGAGDYLNALRGYAEPGVVSANSLTIPDLLARLMGHAELATAVSAVLALLAVIGLTLLVSRARVRASAAVALALAASLVLAPHGNMQDFVILAAGVLAFLPVQTITSLLFLVASDVTLGLWPLGLLRPVTPVLVACGLAGAAFALRRGATRALRDEEINRTG